MEHYRRAVHLAADRRRTIAQEAAQRRLVSTIRIYHLPLHHLVLAQVGSWMIAAGTRLRLRYQQHTHTDPIRGEMRPYWN